MRVMVMMWPQEEVEYISVPLDFRRYFISFTKTLLEPSPFFRRFEEKKPGYSPYVFHVTFGRILDIDREQEIIKIRPPLTYVFSTGINELLTLVVNGAISLYGREAVFGLPVREVRLLPYRQIRQCRVRFNIPGHAVFRSQDGYLDGSDLCLLEEALNCHIFQKVAFLAQEYHISFSEAGRVQVGSPVALRKGVCRHYGGNITTVRGSLTLSGNPETLQFLYDFGLGVRTGQGFGYVEVLRS